ncbi:MAG TPA: cell division protein FtsZ [Deltaproteobacteria bacterium]|jgi:cell division protein FtsZ|nr:cell division protein FtsZ [Deltaproteobacteria bacterium]
MSENGKDNGGPQGPVDLLELEAGGDGDLIEFEGGSRLQASIKVIGVGGGGGNAINTMIEGGLAGVEFVAANTDAQALAHNRAAIKLQLGAEATRGLGCGANPDKGRTAALEARERLRDMLLGTDMVFVTAGMGGGTGTGAAPIVAEVAREVGALTVAVVTKPFHFEGRVRQKHAERGLDELHRVVDTLITIPNHRLLALAGKTTAMRDAFKLADDVLLNAVKGISDLITVHGLINLDFADVRTIMSEMGMALMGTGTGRGETRAVEAARFAISSPLLEDLSIDGARGVLINITGGPDMTLFEVNEAATLVQEAAHEEANIIFGAVVDERIPEGEVRVTVIATGLDDGRMRRDRGRDSDHHAEEFANVRPLRREPAPIAEPVPAAAERHAEPAPAPPPPARPAASEAEWPKTPEDWLSPFEDELDVPTFLRRGSPEKGKTEDRERPTFLRRSAD